MARDDYFVHLWLGEILSSSVQLWEFLDKVIFDRVLDGDLLDQLRVKLAKNFELPSDNPLFLQFFPFSWRECLFRFGAGLFLFNF